MASSNNIPVELIGNFMTDDVLNTVWTKGCMKGLTVKENLIECVLALCEDRRALINELTNIHANLPCIIKIPT